MRIGIMVPALSFSGDAVSRDVIGMYHSVKLLDHKPTIYVWHQMKAKGLRIKTYDSALSSLRPDDLLIYHFCTGDEKGIDILRQARCKTVVKYHNVTPSHFFAPYAKEYVTATDAARAMLPDLARIPGLSALADSDFNASELRALGMADVRVVPPFHQTPDLLGFAQDRSPHPGRFDILTVGRIAPNKGLEFAVRYVLAAAETNPYPVTLTIVGKSDPRLEGYRRTVAYAAERHPHIIRFVESATPEELATLYRTSHAYLTPSMHEGFCVPAIEAMAFGVPVIASDQGALPETCGDAALICASEREFVRAIHLLSNFETEAARLRSRGLKRYASAFSPEAINKAFIDAVPELALRPTPTLVSRLLRADALAKYFKLATAPPAPTTPAH